MYLLQMCSLPRIKLHKKWACVQIIKDRQTQVLHRHIRKVSKNPEHSRVVKFRVLKFKDYTIRIVFRNLWDRKNLEYVVFVKLQHTESIDLLGLGQSLHRKNGFAEEFKIIT